jgi:DNA-binding IclR family transcriptional regulator
VTGGSRSVERALHLVRLLATRGRRGVALTDLARLTSMSHSTVHRLLQRLIAERLARQLEDSKRYALGSLAFELGIAASAQFDIWQPARELMRQLAETLGDTVYLVVRSGNEAVCIERVDGPSPLRIPTLEAGSRRPLGLGAGGLAILAALPGDERQDIVDSIAPDVLVQGRLTRNGLYESIADYQRNGFAHVRSRVTLGTSAIGVHVNDTLGYPIAAISIAATDSRMGSQRVVTLAVQLQVAAKQIQQTLRNEPLS